jgi:uncharacterized protein (TIGR03437 family)
MKYSLSGLLVLCGLASAQQYQVVTIAGQGQNPGWSGDGGQALSAQFTNPIRVALDSNDNLYITDYSNQSIRVVNSNTDIINSIAGNDNVGYTGDGGPSLGAELADPHDVVVDNAGNVYIADTLNSRIRIINTFGDINTFAGNGARGYTGDGGPATNAELTYPTGLALDKAGNLYIADWGNGTVRKVDTNGNISTVAGVGFSTFGADAGDGGPASAAILEMPYAVQVDASGNILIGDIGSSSIRRIDSKGIITTYVSNFLGQNFAIDSAGAIYYANYRNNTVEKITPNGTRLWIGGDGIAGYSGDGGVATAGQFSQPYGVAVDSSGNVYVADSVNAVIRELIPIPGSVGAVANAASNQAFGPPIAGVGSAALAVSPGEITVLFINGFGPQNLTVNSPVNGVFPTKLAGTTVFFNGAPAPIVYTSSTVIAAIAPYEINGQSATTVGVTYNQPGTTVTSTSPSTTVPVAPSAPGIFTADSSGSGQAAALNQDGTLNSPSNPASAGSIVTIYATGEGQTNPAGVDGKLANTAPYPAPLQPVSAQIGGLNAVVNYAGAAPTLVAGIIQLNLQVPTGTIASGAVPVVITIGGVASQLTATIAVASQ